MKILITGASGFIGRNFIYFLSKTNHEVLAIYNSNKPKLRYKNVKYLQFHLGNKDYKVLQRFKPQIIFHFAWSNIPNFSFQNSINNLIHSIIFFNNMAVIKSCKKIIISGSCLEKYNLDKLSKIEEIEYFIWAKNSLKNYIFNKYQKNKITIGWFRFFYIYGNGQRRKSLIPTLIKSFQKKEDPNIQNPQNKNDFIHIEDICNLLKKSIKAKFKSGTFDVGSGKLTSIFEISKILEKEIRKKNVFTNLLKKKNKKKLQNQKIIANNEETKKVFNWSIRNTLQQGLKKTLNDYNKNTI